MKKILLSSLFLMAVQPAVQANENTETAVALPAPVVVDLNMDMEKTMKRMKKSFKKLGKAEDISEMAEPAKILAMYASQAAVLAQKSDHDKRDDLINGINKMRQNVAKLNALVEKGEFKAAKMAVKGLNE